MVAIGCCYMKNCDNGLVTMIIEFEALKMFVNNDAEIKLVVIN